MKQFKKTRDIKVGVIGYGPAFQMGRLHLEDMKRAGMTPRAVVDVDPACLAAAAKDFPNIQTYSSVEKMLKSSEVDLVTLITPHNTHAKIALQCLQAKNHVVSEKPMAITTGQCDAMISTARKNGVVLSVFHNRHWDGCIMGAVKAIRGGAIGQVVRVEAHMGQWQKPRDWWRSSKSISGGVLYDWGIHLLEYTFQLIDSPMVEVSGFAKTGLWSSTSRYKADTNEDEGYVIVRYANGSWSTLCITQVDCSPKPSVVEVTGTKGTYLFDHSTWQMVKYDSKGNTVTTKGANPESQWWRFYRNIAEHLTKAKPLVITAESARRVVHVLDLAGRSAARGAALKPKYN